MFEAQKLESLWPSLPVSLPCKGCEASEEHAPSLFLGQLQSEFSKPPPYLRLEAVHVLSVLESRKKIISKTHQIRLTPTSRLDLLLKPQVEQKVKVDVTQHGRDRTALRSTLFCVNDDAVLHCSGIEPFSDQAQNHRVRNAMGHHLAQPLTIDSREITADVGFKHLHHLLGHDLQAQSLQRVMRATAGSEAMTAFKEIRFKHRFQYARYGPLQQPVPDSGNSQRPSSNFARPFGYLDPPDRRCTIGACFQLCADRLDLRF